MNKEELIKEYDEKAKALRDEFISKLEDDKKGFEVKFPNIYDTLYYFDFVDNAVYVTGFSLSEKNKIRFLYGYYFNSRKEVEQHLKESKLIFKLKQWVKEQQGDWEPNWYNGEEKFRIDVRVKEKLVNIRRVLVYDALVKLPHFKTLEIAQACIDEFGDEILEVFC